MTRISVSVDGDRYSDDVEPRMLLVHYLRERLGKTGTVVGCDTSNCGACTVHAPQLEVSQPITVPVLPSFSRRYCTSSIRGSTSSETAAPSTVSSIFVIRPLP